MEVYTASRSWVTEYQALKINNSEQRRPCNLRNYVFPVVSQGTFVLEQMSCGDNVLFI